MGYTPRKIEFNPPRAYERTERKAPARKPSKRAIMETKREKQARKLWHDLIEKRELQELRKMEG